ncbi:MAG: hypothetical protein ACRDHW_03315 [Ktedonobacteraceae bacterium]
MSTDPEQTDEETDALIALLEELDAIDECSAEAQLNTYSISDNNGGRIALIKQWKPKFLAIPLLARLLPFLKKPSISD